MKRGKSTGAPTKAQAARIEAVKLGPCMACLVLVERGELERFKADGPCDAHHIKSGNIRRGHDYTIGLCGWHHRQIVDWAHTHADMREAYGPSLMDGSRKFREAFGSDDELLERQNKWLAENGGMA